MIARMKWYDSWTILSRSIFEKILKDFFIHVLYKFAFHRRRIPNLRKYNFVYSIALLSTMHYILSLSIFIEPRKLYIWSSRIIKVIVFNGWYQMICQRNGVLLICTIFALQKWLSVDANWKKNTRIFMKINICFTL